MTAQSYIPVLLLFQLLFPVTARTRSSSCFPALDENPNLLSPCLSNTCFLLKETQPDVDFGFHPHPPEQIPWKCRYRTRLFQNVKGLFYDFIDMMSPLDESYCIHLGSSCTFNDLTNILEDTANSSYKLIAAGGLTIVNYRITLNSSPSMSFYGGRMQIFGDRASGNELASKHAEAILKSFSVRSWFFIASVFLFLFLIRATLISVLGSPINLVQAWWAMLGEPYMLKKGSRAQDRIRLAFWLVWWNKVFISCMALNVLWFEISVVGFIFDPNSFVLDVNTKNLSSKALGTFAVVANSAEEYFLRLMTGRVNKSSNATVPWIRCTDSAQIFDALLNGSARYGVTHEHYGKYLLRRQGACSKFILYNTRDISQEYQSGWYYGKGITPFERTVINQNISTLRDLQRFDEKIYAVIPDEEDSCGDQPRQIQMVVLLISNGIILILFFFAVFCMLVHQAIIRQRRKFQLPNQICAELHVAQQVD